MTGKLLSTPYAQRHFTMFGALMIAAPFKIWKAHAAHCECISTTSGRNAIWLSSWICSEFRRFQSILHLRKRCTALAF